MSSAHRPKSYPRTPAVEPLESRALCAATLAVANLNDTGAGSLRDTLAVAAAGDVVDLRQLAGTITLGSELLIDKRLTLLGPGAGTLTLSGDNRQTRAVRITQGVSVVINGLRIDSAGDSDDGPGGAIWVDGNVDAPRGALALADVFVSNCVGGEAGGGLAVEFADVTLTRCRFAGNTAVGTIAAFGGAVAISQTATLRAVDSTFDYNTAHATGNPNDPYRTGNETTALGGGVALLGAGPSALINCTLAQNAATADVAPIDNSTSEAMGGGLLLAVDGNATVLNCTIANNTAGGSGAAGIGGGLNVFSFGTSNYLGTDTLKIANTVIAGNAAGVGPDAFGLDVSGVAKTNFKNNFVANGTASGLAHGVNGNRVGTQGSPLSAMLGGVTDNGGPVPTMLPQAGSPLIGMAAGIDSPRRDARGYPRTGPYDIGAAERQSNYAPSPIRFPDTAAAMGVLYASHVAATDVDGDAITFSLINAPAWLSLQSTGPGTAVLSGTPTVTDLGSTLVTLRVSDGTLAWDEAFTLTAAADPVLLSSNGVLRVVGSDAAENIRVWQPRGSGQAIRASIGKRSWNFSAAAITAIQVFARGGDDTVVASCIDLGAYVNAGDGDDTIVGGEHVDSLTAAAGDDWVYGRGGNDWMDGNGGRDRLFGDGGDDRIYGGNGNDTLDGGTGRDVLYGEVGSNLYLTRDRARDWVFATNKATNFVIGDADRDSLNDASVLPEVAATPRKRRR